MRCAFASMRCALPFLMFRQGRRKWGGWCGGCHTSLKSGVAGVWFRHTSFSGDDFFSCHTSFKLLPAPLVVCVCCTKGACRLWPSHATLARSAPRLTHVDLG